MTAAYLPLNGGTGYSHMAWLKFVRAVVRSYTAVPVIHWAVLSTHGMSAG